jgi:hypothetical protein
LRGDASEQLGKLSLGHQAQIGRPAPFDAVQTALAPIGENGHAACATGLNAKKRGAGGSDGGRIHIEQSEIISK